jgi:hypothetical protein
MIFKRGYETSSLLFTRELKYNRQPITLSKAAFQEVHSFKCLRSTQKGTQKKTRIQKARVALKFTSVY